jgi:hypothetical protein
MTVTVMATRMSDGFNFALILDDDVHTRLVHGYGLPLPFVIDESGDVVIELDAEEEGVGPVVLKVPVAAVVLFPSVDDPAASYEQGRLAGEAKIEFIDGNKLNLLRSNLRVVGG